MAKLTATEKETIILFNEKEDTVEVYTYNGKIKRNIEKARSAAPSLYRLIRDGRGRRRDLPPAEVSFFCPFQGTAQRRKTPGTERPGAPA